MNGKGVTFILEKIVISVGERSVQLEGEEVWET